MNNNGKDLSRDDIQTKDSEVWLSIGNPNKPKFYMAPTVNELVDLLVEHLEKLR